MRTGKRVSVFFTVITTSGLVQMLISLEWITVSKHIIPKRSGFNWTSLLVASTEDDVKVLELGEAAELDSVNSQKEFAVNVIVSKTRSARIVKGNFHPSFSLGNGSVSVTAIDRYNEFEYQDFKLPAPKFPRSIDKKLFYSFSTGLELLETVPYIKRRGVVEVIRNGSYPKSFLCGWPSNYTLMYVRLSRSVHYDKLCPLLSPEGNTFQHFLDGLLPKLIQVREILLHPDMKLLIARPRSSDEQIIMKILDRIGIKRSQIVWSTGYGFSADYMVAACITPPLHPILWRTARNLLGVKDKLQVSLDMSYIVLLTRAGSHNGGRNLLNEVEVASFLQRRYGKDRLVIFSGGYSFEESLSLFGKSSLIIGVHGGAFYNLNFAPKGTKLLEIMPYLDKGYPKGLATTIFWSMAGLNGQDYWRLFVRSSGVQNNVILKLQLLNETLYKMNV